MRPTDFCHLNETACTRTSYVPGSLRDFHRVDTPRSLGLRAAYRGTECFTALVNASADGSQTRAAFFCLSSTLRLLGERADSSVGVVFPRRLLPIEPLTPQSPLPLPRNVGAPSRLLQLWLFSLIAFPREEAAEAAFDHRLVKGDGS